MSVSQIRPAVVIMADGRRQEFVVDLLEQLGDQADVVYDACDCEHGRPQCPVEGHRDRWATGSRALLQVLEDPWASHGIVLQDDAIICRDFVAGATRALEQVPDQPVSFYAGKPRPQDAQVARAIAKAKSVGSSWMRFEGPWWGVAVSLPVRLIEPAVHAANQAKFRKILNYDVRLARGLREIGEQCCYTLPSLADHRQGHPSLIPGGRPQGRRAHWFVGEDVSALTVEWTPLEVPSLGYIQETVGGRVQYRCGGCHYRTPAKYQIARHVTMKHPAVRAGAR